uniref:Uncharacterized protein n=1 Tax=Siphoviridae sp. ct37J14 TaxID=2826280 RepID=A0A8S5M0S7_9CAUD|nr:MAG TPA: hypothetical protein [Siphoviridae sp. ct37J14]
MEKIVSLAVDDVQKIDFDSYSDDEFAIAKMGFLSTRPNAHNLIIDEDVLRESASSALNKWVVADMFMGEPTTHTKNEHIVGRIPRSQSVEFVYDDDGYLRAYVDTVISKIYAKDFCKAFEQDKNRAVSVEMKIFTDGEDDNIVQRFNIMGVTVLGKSIKPSCPESDIEFVRFSEEDADKFFEKQSDSLSQLKNFVEERKQSMAEKYVNHPINTSKDAVYTGEWDGDEAKKNLVKEKNYKTLAPKVCLRLEEGWEDREVTKLGYPVMGLYDGEWRYSTKALSSALAYAKQNDETEVVNKIEAIYKKLDLDDDSERKEDKKMAEIEFSAVDIGDMWGRLYTAMREARNWEYGIQGIYEEDNKKFAILVDDAKKLYRLDFSLTEDGLTLADEVVEVKQEFTETDNMKKFAEPENVAEYRLAECDHDDDEEDHEMSADEMKAKMAELEKDIESRDNIIMEKDAELEELRKFKAEVEEQRKAATVESIMAECKEYMSDEQYKEMREEGMACKMSEIDGWTNKVKAVSFSAVKKNVKKTNDGLFRFAAPIDNNKKSNSVWDRI